MLYSAEHEILPAYEKQTTDKNSCFFCSGQLKLKFSLLMNMKMPTFVGIFIFISRENYILSRVEHKKSFITLRPDHHIQAHTQDTTVNDIFEFIALKLLN